MLDEKDLKIIEILKKDSRTPYTEIARILSLSEATIRKRIKNLEDKKVITGYSIKIDKSKLGYNTIAYVGLDVEPSMFLDAAKKMTEIDEVKYVATATGDHMIMTEIVTRNGKELMKIISEKIGRIKGVHRICPAIILEVLKDEC
ncbi:MAG: Lrp/AsnC family transcriptional regulator [Methanomicrobia archaeon]|nr:Lrp/AsnC family transcriptional regulator [Methanomicrobia archaeon]HDM22955.1 Lrp/AsnC family transcriptional regulator [Methanomicrobia archaeon]